LGEGKGEWEGGERRKRGERGVEGGAESQQDGRAQSAAAMAVGPRLVDSSADEGHSDGDGAQQRARVPVRKKFGEIKKNYMKQKKE